MVYYLKYRPQTIDQLDNSLVREKLTSLLSSQSFPHAFLFTGPKGLGKTSSARILAKAVNCMEKKEGTVEPCNLCGICTSITNGSCIDVIEIDAASNRGIDEIRELKETIRLTPSQTKKKIYIIDEVHMLTTEAFNALLKTLEEPPGHALFVLCTTEVHKVPETILSRCCHIAFSKATKEELLRSFNRIVTGEKIKITPEALDLIAKFSDGGFRDGTKLLEEAVAFSGKGEITPEKIEQQLHMGSFALLRDELIQSFLTKDVTKALNVCKQIEASDMDVRFFMTELLEKLHTLLLVKIGIEKSDEAEDTNASIGELTSLLELISKSTAEVRFSYLPLLPLELAIVSWCEEKGETLTPSIKTEEIKVVGKTDTGSITVTSLKKEIGEIEKKKALYGEEEVVKEESADSKVTKMEIHNAPNGGEVTQEWLNTFWKSLINEVNKINRKLAGVLRGCAISAYSSDGLIIQASHSFHKEQLDQSQMMEILIETTKILVGKPIKVEVVLRGN